METKKLKLLIVDDDTRLRELLNQFLASHNFHVQTARNTLEASQKLKEETFDLMVLDVMMPQEKGTTFAQKLRQNMTNTAHQIPILMLTARSEVEERIEGLEAGADDYLAKPFEPRELILRIHKLLERTQRGQETPSKLGTISLSFGRLSYHIEKNLLTSGEEIIHLTSAEAELMHFFALSPRTPLSRFELAEKAGVSLSPRTIDVQITRLRKKLEVDPKRPKYLRTVRHKGYALWPD